MSAPAIPQNDLYRRVVAFVREAAKPLSFAGLAKLVKAKTAEHEALRAAILSAVDSGEIYRWPDHQRSQYFWHVSPEQKAREVILTVAATQALSKPDLRDASKRGKKLPGLSDKSVQNLISALVAQKQLREVSGLASGSKLIVPADHSEAYFKAARAFLEKKFRAAGFDPSVFFAENSPPRDKLLTTQSDAAALILDSVRSLEPVKGVPVSTLRLRNHLPHLSKQEFDAAALELRKKEQVFLSQHVDPYNISREEKELLIDGQDGTYYVAIAIR
jgi:hypothetical protein